METQYEAGQDRFRTKKSYGQNFLQDRQVVAEIIAAAAIGEEDRVIEIGPGLGALTKDLLARAREVNIIEIDKDLISFWQQRPDPRLHLHAGDALGLNWRTLFPAPPYILAANLPYNISTPILFKMIEERDLFKRLVLMFQKEVGDRICAPPGGKDYGVLSVFCQLWFDVRKVVIVPPGAFHPAPKVHSIVVQLDPLPAARVALDDYATFRRVVKGAFGQRRKTLRNALGGAGFTTARIDAVLAATAIDGRRRGETLSLSEFALLSNAFGDEEGEAFHGCL
ncbi:MAG: ribosomal RNA small subunit methyltransferase A [Deltaproteobacteria bacterium HGW-Deltaproteobacteria-4]|nr:MAG: ribosomal RNA small subunit methyltransferase A [Deltaproteobacteria bacterium HGW-Deltaproteobacteria-4]